MTVDEAAGDGGGGPRGGAGDGGASNRPQQERRDVIDEVVVGTPATPEPDAAGTSGVATKAERRASSGNTGGGQPSAERNGDDGQPENYIDKPGDGEEKVTKQEPTSNTDSDEEMQGDEAAESEGQQAVALRRQDGGAIERTPLPEQQHSLTDIYAELRAIFQQHPEATVDEMLVYSREYFKKVFAEQARHGQRPKAGSNLPETTQAQGHLLVELFRVHIVGRKGSAAMVHNAVRDLVIACFKSSWAFDKLLEHRVSTAQVPVAPPNTAWGKAVEHAVPAKTRGVAEDDRFKFDPMVYSAEEIARLHAICSAPEAFGTTPRKPTEDEWTVLWGIMNGSIAARTYPQFMKRCCTAEQLQFFYHFMIHKGEGELFA